MKLSLKFVAVFVALTTSIRTAYTGTNHRYAIRRRRSKDRKVEGVSIKTGTSNELSALMKATVTSATALVEDSVKGDKPPAPPPKNTKPPIPPPPRSTSGLSGSSCVNEETKSTQQTALVEVKGKPTQKNAPPSKPPRKLFSRSSVESSKPTDGVEGEKPTPKPRSQYQPSAATVEGEKPTPKPRSQHQPQPQLHPQDSSDKE